jgi:hypothetical protein
MGAVACSEIASSPITINHKYGLVSREMERTPTGEGKLARPWTARLSIFSGGVCALVMAELSKQIVRTPWQRFQGGNSTMNVPSIQLKYTLSFSP